MVTAELTDNPWIKGGKIGRRYTLSQMVLAKPEQVIWKAADEKLNIECFILYVVSSSGRRELAIFSMASGFCLSGVSHFSMPLPISFESPREKMHCIM